MFSCEIFKNKFFQVTPPVAASVKLLLIAFMNVKNKLLLSLNLNQFNQYSHFLPPENIRKSLVFWDFQGEKNENIDPKCGYKMGTLARNTLRQVFAIIINLQIFCINFTEKGSNISFWEIALFFYRRTILSELESKLWPKFKNLLRTTQGWLFSWELRTPVCMCFFCFIKI